MIVFETERLRARPFTDADAEAAHAIYGDAEVMRYLGPGDVPPDSDPDFTRRALAKTTQRYAAMENGLGFWAIERKADGAVVGAVFLSPLDDGEIEVGYHIARAQWGNGYATEAARAALAHAFDVLDLKRIVAICYPQNHSSLNVLRKLDMRYEGRREFFDKDLEFFVAERT